MATQRRIVSVATCFLAFNSMCSSAIADPITISGVPNYQWYHGCEPTSVAMVMGYWDAHGYPSLFLASGSAVYVEANVQDEICSPQHIAANYPNPYNPTYPIPPPNNTSIADWIGTSYLGDNYVPNIPPAVKGWASYKGVNLQTSSVKFSTNSGTTLWEDVVADINAEQPLLFVVDANGSGTVNHVVPVIGYDGNHNGDGEYYACYTTYNNSYVWEKYQAIAVGNVYGVSGAYQVVPVSAPIPEPATVNLLITAVLGILWATKRHRLPPSRDAGSF